MSTMSTDETLRYRVLVAEPVPQSVIGAAELALMKPSARLVNTSRGPLTVETALLDALANDRIAGTAIDVYDVKPSPNDHPYRRADNLISTPHSGYLSRGLYERFYRDSVNNISTWIDERKAG
jgi:phosphoglycerate dehydrogenase-like enzyme